MCYNRQIIPNDGTSSGGGVKHPHHRFLIARCVLHDPHDIRVHAVELDALFPGPINFFRIEKIAVAVTLVVGGLGDRRTVANGSVLAYLVLDNLVVIVKGRF